MLITVRTCDCFFDVGLCNQMNCLEYDKFRKMCLDVETKNRPFIIQQSYSLHGLLLKFLKGYVRTVSVEKLIKRLEAYYLFCFDDVDDNVGCSLREDDFFKEVYYYCIVCQHTVLFEFSKKLHVFSAINFS